MSVAPRPPALLTMPDHCGTLAAARCLGAQGIDVWMAGADYAAPAAWSKSVHRRLRAPPLANPVELIDWLLEEGARNPGAVLYPTCDDLAWLQALRAADLAKHYQLYAPVRSAIEAVLDKGQLLSACAKVGLPTPRSFCPQDEEEVRALARDAPMPLLIKQRTQVCSSHSKGQLIEQREDVVSAYEGFVRTNVHHRLVNEYMPASAHPILQEFYESGLGKSYLVSGFIDRTGKHYAARAATKVLQRPRTLGIALCLEASPMDAGLLEKIAALCRNVGYFGVFQVEFLSSGDARLLIDFNPRYYHYLAFDVARGLPLPLLVHLGATGQDAALEQAVKAAQTEPASAPKAFTHWLHLQEMLAAQAIAGTMSWEEANRWRAWYSAHRHELVDAIHSPNDLLPSTMALVSQVAHRVRHPRSFIRQIALDR